jgi:hypothetical protein
MAVLVLPTVVNYLMMFTRFFMLTTVLMNTNATALWFENIVGQWDLAVCFEYHVAMTILLDKQSKHHCK